jgi:hypothetical protein
MQCSAKRPHRFNALKHGVLSRYTVLPWEDAEEYRALVAALVAEHAPQGPTEEHKDSGEFWWGMPSNKDGSISENRDGRLNARGSSHVRFAPRRCIDRVRIANLLRQSVQN